MPSYFDWWSDDSQKFKHHFIIRYSITTFSFCSTVQLLHSHSGSVRIWQRLLIAEYDKDSEIAGAGVCSQGGLLITQSTALKLTALKIYHHELFTYRLWTTQLNQKQSNNTVGRCDKKNQTSYWNFRECLPYYREATNIAYYQYVHKTAGAKMLCLLSLFVAVSCNTGQLITPL